MTPLPPENAPQLVTCDVSIHSGPHRNAGYCKNPKPVAAPENPPELCVSCGGTKENPKTRLAGCSDDLCWSKFHEAKERPRPTSQCAKCGGQMLRITVGMVYRCLRCEPWQAQSGTHPPPDERTVIPKWTKPGDWFFLESPSCTEKYSVQRRTDSGCTLVCSTPWHHQNAKRDMQNIADLHNRARAPQSVSSEKESSTWNTPATNAGLSRSPSNLCNAETTGTISAPSASESSSLKEKVSVNEICVTQAPKPSDPNEVFQLATNKIVDEGKLLGQPGRIYQTGAGEGGGAQTAGSSVDWQPAPVAQDAFEWLKKQPGPLSFADVPRLLAEYASSSNAAPVWIDLQKMQAERDVLLKSCSDNWKRAEALEGQLREAQEQVALMDEREAEHLATVERLQKALRVALDELHEVNLANSHGTRPRNPEFTKIAEAQARAALGDPKQKGAI